MQFISRSFVVPKISRVQNEHLELASGNYLYLANIWLSVMFGDTKVN